MVVHDSLISELEESIRVGSQEKRVETLRKVTDLFLAETERFNDEQITVFDDVLNCLIERVETKALAELSRRLAPIANAPNEVIQKLARDDEISVASPVLMQSTRLTEPNLVEIAKTKGQAHLLAIAGRDHVGMPVTEVLVERGDNTVLNRLATNSGAVFSEASFTTLVERAEKDESLAMMLGRRLDIPLRLFRELLLRATEAVRTKLLALAGDNQAEIQSVLSQISDQMSAENTPPRDYRAASRLVRMLQERGELNQDTVLTFLRANKYEEVVATLAALCGLPLDHVDRSMQAARADAVLIICKAAGFEWATTRAVLKNRLTWKPILPRDLDNAWGDYVKLSKATANRVVRFWQVRGTFKDADPTQATAPTAA